MTEKMVILCLVLLVFGIGYNALISYAERQGYLSGFTWTAVVLGVAVTVAGVMAVFWSIELPGWQYGLVSLGAFASSGTPMAVGAMVRYVSARHADQVAMRVEALNDER